jgi:hypothetical protein
MKVTTRGTKPVIFREVGQFTKEVMELELFINTARKHPGAFTRIRCLTLIVIMLILLNQIKKTTQKSLDHYFDTFVITDITLPIHNKHLVKLGRTLSIKLNTSLLIKQSSMYMNVNIIFGKAIEFSL